MNTNKSMRRGSIAAWLAAGAAVAVVGAASGVALASSGGNIYACEKSDGSITIHASTYHCPSPQKSLSWSAAGPAGAKGATGTTGPAGPRGKTGPAGPRGKTGSRGGTGLKGPTGKTGPAGRRGKTGPKGSTGKTGPTGSLKAYVGRSNKNFPKLSPAPKLMVESPKLPAGSYLVSAALSFQLAGNDSGTCWVSKVTTSGFPPDDGYEIEFSSPSDGPATDDQSPSINDFVSGVPTNGRVGVYCIAALNDSDNKVAGVSATMVAYKVGEYSYSDSK